MNKIDQASREALGFISVSTIVEKFGVVTINGMSFIDYKGKQVPAFHFVESDGGVFPATSVKLKAFADAILRLYDNDIDAANEGFHHTGIRIEISESKTKSGNKFWQVTRLGRVNFDEPEDEPETDSETGEVIDKPADKPADKDNFDLF